MAADKNTTKAELLEAFEALERRLADYEAVEAEREEALEELAVRAQIQQLVMAISTDCINASYGEIDEVIDQGLQTVGELVEVDRSYVYRRRPEVGGFEVTHEWCAPGVTPRIGHAEPIRMKARLPWLWNMLKQPQGLQLDDVSRLPAEAGADADWFAGHEVKAIAMVPMSTAGNVLGIVGFDAVRKPREWPAELHILLNIVGQIFVNALARKDNLEALEYERRLIDALMGNIPDAIYFKDIESRFTRVSQAMVDMFGLSDFSEMKGKTDFDFFSDEHAQQAFDDERRIIETGEPIVSMVEKETWPDGRETWVSTTKMPLRDETGEIMGTFGISRNVTQRILMEEALEERAKLLERLNTDLEARNRELDEFTFMASHDLQEPLRKLTTFSGMLEDDIKKGDEEDITYDLRVLSSAAQRMQTLVQGLLALSRSGRQDMKREQVKVADIVDAALDALEVRIEESNAEIDVGTLPVVAGDRLLLTQLFQNLIGNALKFKGDEAPRVRISAERIDEGWLLGVADNGIGLKPDYANQIFSPFRRLHARDEYEGTGIGLAICRKIVERHGGRIWVESELGAGAHFKFIIPNEEGENGA